MSLVRKHINCDGNDMAELEQIAKAKGGRAHGYTVSAEVQAAIKEHIRRHHAQQEEATMTPIWDQLLQERIGGQETWLRPGVWAGATYSATAALLLLELLCGHRLDPEEAQKHFEQIRGRAWKMVRKERDPGDPAGRGE